MPVGYKEFQLKSGKKINTLILKTELAKLSMKNDSLKGAISALKKELMEE